MTREGHPDALANAAAVAGPPMAALEATSKRWGATNPPSDFISSVEPLLRRFHSTNRRIPAKVAPWTLYNIVKNKPIGRNAARTESAIDSPPVPAVAKKM